jgi:hypothetical protein
LHGFRSKRPPKTILHQSKGMFRQNVFEGSAEKPISTQYMRAGNGKITILIDTLLIPAKNFMGEKSNVFGAENESQKFLPLRYRPAFLQHRVPSD